MSRFADYATSAAFHLSLSRPQVRMLCQLHQCGRSHLLLGTFRALEDKGLVERVKGPACTRVQLTEAGRAVVPLLKLAGVYIENALDEPERLAA